MKTTRILVSVVVAGGLALAQMAMAQPAPGAAPAPAISPEVQAALNQARSMADSLNIPQQSRQILNNMRLQMLQLVVQNTGKSVDDSLKIVDEVIMPDFNAAAPELTEAMLQPWATNFTAAELKALAEFYATPLGKKLQSTVPAVAAQMSKIQQSWSQNLTRVTLQKHQPELHERGLK
jgi:hypothetical protein